MDYFYVFYVLIDFYWFLRKIRIVLLVYFLKNNINVIFGNIL